MTNRVILVFLLLAISFSNSLGQRKQLPKGKWFNYRNPLGEGISITQLHFINEATIIFTPFASVIVDDENKKPLSATITIDTMSVNKKTGKLLLEHKMGKRVDYGFFLYRWINKREFQVHIPRWFEPENKSEALKAFDEGFIIQNLAKRWKLPSDRFSIYDSGIIYRSEKLYKKLNQLPTLREPNKKQLMTLYKRFLELCLQKKNQTFLNNPSTKEDGLHYLMEVALAEKSHNPFTSFKGLIEAEIKFEKDAEFKKLLNKIQAIVIKSD